MARCDVVLLAVFDTTRSRTSSTNALLPAVTPGARKTVLCASTCDPDRIAALAEKVAPRGLRLIETPVSGSSAQVRNGDGVGLIGGDRDTIDGVADIIDALYPKWFYMGAAGNGGRAKLAINHMLGPQPARARRRPRVRASARADPKAFLDVARQSAAYSQVMDIKGRKDGERRLFAAGFHPSVAEGLPADPRTGGKRGQEMPLAALNAAVLEACVQRHEGERDNSAVIEEIRRRQRGQSGEQAWAATLGTRALRPRHLA